MLQEEKLKLDNSIETKNEEKVLEKVSDSTTNKKLRIIQVTQKGARDLAQLLMEELGYIEPDEFSRVLDRVEEWINEQCGALALFYIKARQNGLVPNNEPTDSIPKQIRKVGKDAPSMPKNETIVSRFINFLKRGDTT